MSPFHSSPSSVYDANGKRRRQALSCEFCRRRKVRCDRLPQCNSCTSRGIACVWAEGVVPTGTTESATIENLHREIAWLTAQIAEKDREIERQRKETIPICLQHDENFSSSAFSSLSSLDWSTLSSLSSLIQQPSYSHVPSYSVDSWSDHSSPEPQTTAARSSSLVMEDEPSEDFMTILERIGTSDDFEKQSALQPQPTTSSQQLSWWQSV